MEKGWIKLNRQITEHWVWGNHEYAFAWIDLLLMVNHENKKILVDGVPTTIKRGQVLTSICKLSQRWGWNRKKTYAFISALEKDGMIDKSSTSRYTTLTIANYGKFQDVGTTKGTSKGTSVGTTPGTSKGQVRVHKQEYIKNEEELKERKEEELDQLPDGVVGSDEEEDPDAWWKEIAEEEGVPLSECEKIV